MDVLVLVRRCMDYRVTARLNADHSAVQTDGVKMSTNPFDEIALESAIRLREAGQIERILLVAAGGDELLETLRAGLAMGADEAFLLSDDAPTLRPIDCARLLASFVQQQKPGLVLMGKQAIDCDEDQLGQMLAGQLHWPQACFAAQITLSADNKTMTVVSESDHGSVSRRISLPAVVTADLRLAEPRYITLPNIMRAKQKPLQRLVAKNLCPDIAPDQRVTAFDVAPGRKPGKRVPDLTGLLQILKQEELLS